MMEDLGEKVWYEIMERRRSVETVENEMLYIHPLQKRRDVC